MTTPAQRAHALVSTREFLVNLSNGAYKGAPKHIRNKAKTLLRHYPWDTNVLELAEHCPDILEVGDGREEEQG